MSYRMSVGKIGEFNLNSGSWSTYIDRMEQYFLANDVKVNLQVATLIACVGDATYELMVDLCSPKKPSEIKFNELVHLVKKHIQPTPSILAERYKFRKRTQAQSETVAQFAAALKHLARDCDFQDNLEENLRDQFVCGLHSESTRQRLFCDDSVTFASAFKKAVALEAAANDAAAVEGRTTDGAVHAVHAQRARPAGGADRRAGPRRRDEGSGGRGRHSSGFNNNRPKTASCVCCGSTDHARWECRYQNYTCRVCLRPGHLQRVCSRAERKAEGQVLRLDTAWRVDELERSEDGDSERASSAVDNDDEGVGGPGGLYTVQLTGCDPVVAEVTVANRRLAMHVDTGSPISCISDKMYAELFSEFSLQDNKYKLRGYDGSDIKCIGYIVVPVTHGEISENLNLYIVLKGAVPLLGREWLNKLCMSVSVPKSVFSMDKDKISGVFDLNNLISKYPAVYGGQPRRQCHGAVPASRRARLLTRGTHGDAELQHMESAGIVEPVPSSDWASGLLSGLKNNDSLRNCEDNKTMIIPVSGIDQFSLPRSVDLFNNLKRVRPYDKSIEAVVRAPKRSNTSELKLFPGMVNFYSKFMNSIILLILLAVLYELFKKGVEWKWREERDLAFQDIGGSPVLIYNDERLPLIVSCDASARVLGAAPCCWQRAGARGGTRGGRPAAAVRVSCAELGGG